MTEQTLEATVVNNSPAPTIPKIKREKPTPEEIEERRKLKQLEVVPEGFSRKQWKRELKKQRWQDTKQEIIGGKLGLLYGNSTTNDLSVFTGFQLLKRNLINLYDGNFDSIKFFNGQFLKSSILNQLKYL